MCKHLITQIINKDRIKIRMQVSCKAHKFAIYLADFLPFFIIFIATGIYIYEKALNDM